MHPGQKRSFIGCRECNCTVSPLSNGQSVDTRNSGVAGSSRQFTASTAHLTKVRLGFNPQRDFSRQLQVSALCKILCAKKGISYALHPRTEPVQCQQSMLSVSVICFCQLLVSTRLLNRADWAIESAPFALVRRMQYLSFLSLSVHYAVMGCLCLYGVLVGASYAHVATEAMCRRQRPVC